MIKVISNNYPKILIVGPSFNFNSGGGITISNLFYGWPEDRMASVSFQKNEDWTICKLQYLLGKEETNKHWPFSLLQNNRPSKIYNFLQDHPAREKSNDSCEDPFVNNKYFVKTLLQRNTKIILKFIGLFPFLHRTKISDRLAAFIEDFKPDVVYSQLADHEIIRLVDEINNRYHLPFAIHVMDDWPIVINREGIFGLYHNNRTHNAFRKILKKASLCLAISDQMAEEFQKRYNKNWLVFHNPIDTSIWYNNNTHLTDTHFVHRLIYVGRIGIANTKSLLEVINVAKEIRKQDEFFEFYIYSPDYDRSSLKINITGCDYIKILPPVPHDKVPEILSTASILVLPLDFNESSKRFAKYSMPTKATEYMASGVPIIVFAPTQNAVSEYARNEKWASVVDKPDSKHLKAAIIELLNNQELRISLIQNARKVVMKNHTALIIREQFRESLNIASIKSLINEKE